MKHLNRGFQVVIGESHDIGVGAVAEHDSLLLQNPSKRADIIAQSRSPFEVQRFGCGIHLTLEVTGKAISPPGQEVAEVKNDLAVFLGAHTTDTGC